MLAIYGFFQSILRGLQNLLGSYGLAVIGFTLIVRICLFYFDFKSRKSMRKMSSVQPKVAMLQKKYANDRDKLNRKMSELYKQEGVSPLSGCLPMLLSYPILIIMFNAMRFYANDQVVFQVVDFLKQGGTVAPNYEPFLWIKNLYMADNPFVSAMPNLSSLQLAADSWRNLNVLTLDRVQELIGGIEPMIANSSLTLTEVQAAFWDEMKAVAQQGDAQKWLTFLNSTAEGMKQSNLNRMLEILSNAMTSTPYYQANCGNSNLSVVLLGNIQKDWNGLIILPIASAVSQILMTKLNPSQQQPAAAGDAQAQASQSTGKFMMWFFPIFSLWICYSSTGAFALYWVASNLIAMIQTVAVNKYLDSKEKKDKIAGEGIVQ